MWADLRAWWRLLWGVCPLCNSDAPGIDKCQVCWSYRGEHPPSQATKARWRRRYRLWVKRS
jgi:hypothetical protein